MEQLDKLLAGLDIACKENPLLNKGMLLWDTLDSENSDIYVKIPSKAKGLLLWCAYAIDPIPRVLRILSVMRVSCAMDMHLSVHAGGAAASAGPSGPVWCSTTRSW